MDVGHTAGVTSGVDIGRKVIGQGAEGVEALHSRNLVADIELGMGALIR